MNRIITLVTDFGWDDHFAGAVKGAILSVNPDAKIVDVTHGVAPHDVLGGALAVRAAHSFFPLRSIHLAVVDPGVGGPRRGLLVVTESHVFVGPDNGIFSLVMADEEVFTCYRLTATHYFRPEVSPTFHARDIFGPVAGWLSRGVEFRHFGERIDDPVRLALPEPVDDPSGVLGEVIHVDRFGNLVTNLGEAHLHAVKGVPVVCRVGDGSGPPAPLATHYAVVAPGAPCVLTGSSGFLEVVVNRGRAADLYGAGKGTRVALTAG